MPTPSKRFVLNAEQRIYVEDEWGVEDWLWNARYCGKKITVYKNKTSPWVAHKVRDKVIYIEKGKLLLSYGWSPDDAAAATLTMTPDMAFHIPAGMWHKFHGLDEALILELGTHHNEKDILRADQPDADYDEQE